MKKPQIFLLCLLPCTFISRAQTLPATGTVLPQQTRNVTSGLEDQTLLRIRNTGAVPLKFCTGSSQTSACTGASGKNVEAGASADVTVAELGGISSGTFLNVSNEGVLAGSYTVARAAGPGGTACVSASADAWQLNPLQINSPDIFLCGRYNNVGIGTGSPVYKLHVNGSQAVEGNLTGNGNFYLKGDQVSSGNLSLDGNLLVGGSATTGPLSAVTGSFSGAVSLGAGLTVAGHTGLSSLTANGNMVLNGNETLTGNLNVTGLTSLSNGTDNLLVLNRPDGAGKKVQVSFRRNGNEYWAIGSGAAGSGGVQANDFYIFGTNSYTIPFYISPTGKIGINTVAPSEHYALSVNGDIRSKRIKVETAWPDYVFAEGYRLMPLTELEEYIRLNRHLPEIPSEKSIESGGADVGELLKLQMQKIEELTLYIIQQQAEIDLLKKSINK